MFGFMNIHVMVKIFSDFKQREVRKYEVIQSKTSDVTKSSIIGSVFINSKLLYFTMEEES